VYIAYTHFFSNFGFHFHSPFVEGIKVFSCQEATREHAAVLQRNLSASEMTYIVSSGALNSTHSLTVQSRMHYSSVIPKDGQKHLLNLLSLVVKVKN